MNKDLFDYKDKYVIGLYYGQGVYYCTKDTYFKHKDKYDQLNPWYWCIIDDNILVQGGKVIAQLNVMTDEVTRLEKAVTIDEWYHEENVVYEDEHIKIIRKD